VLGPEGHGWTDNGTPEPGATLHSNRGHYVASAFDVVHDRGLRTGAYVSKSKFVLFDRSYDGKHGAPDTTGADNGRDKIDVFVYERDTEALVSRFVADATADPARYTFVHLRDPDSAGHEWSWSLNVRSPYMQAVRRMDRLVGKILDLVESDPRLAGRTSLIITADHGGSDYGHSADRPEHSTVPFYVWGPGVPAADLYALNTGVLNPEGTQPGRAEPDQPIRNGAAANLALSLLGLDPVPGSTIGLSAAGWKDMWAGH
jgi:arylsulfatase A-like enzyme